MTAVCFLTLIWLRLSLGAVSLKYPLVPLSPDGTLYCWHDQEGHPPAAWTACAGGGGHCVYAIPLNRDIA